MNEILERICSDMDKETQLLFNQNHIEELKFESFTMDDMELERKLVMLAARYLVEIEHQKKEIVELRDKVEKCNRVNEEIRRHYGVSYKEVLSKKNEKGIRPAKKAITMEEVEVLEKMGLSDKEICESLKISKSTLWRRRKEWETETDQREAVEKDKMRFSFNGFNGNS